MNGAEISIVVQGPIVSNPDMEDGMFSTEEVLKSIRSNYPEAEIVLSTWKGANTDGLIYNKLVLSDDPGAFTHAGSLINSNRMITSTKAGIEATTKPYVIKTRTDILFTDDKLLEQIKYITPAESDHSVFTKMVLSTIFYVRNPLKLNLVFHPSDIFLVGTREDLLSYFDVPTAPRSFYVNDDESTKIVPEQYFFVYNILKKKNADFHIPRWGYSRIKYFFNSERYIFSNFMFFSVEDLGIEFPERLYSVFMPEANYTLGKARFLSKVFRDKPFYGPLIISSRLLRYFLRYNIPYYLKAFWNNMLMPLVSRKSEVRS
jgi:hypothetical protein